MDDEVIRPDLEGRPFFFCGIGGSGMLPLAQIARGTGHAVAGSDRSMDQGRTPEKFEWLAENGFELFPQDGSGITSSRQILIASAAVEDTVPEVAKARTLGNARMSRAELLSALFNEAAQSVAIGGTSGKSTVTGMIAWIMHQAGLDPTVMNGAVMKNFANADNPFASARVGDPGVFVSEVDESDGSIALYRPSVAVLLNVSLDHKSIEELEKLFGDYLAKAQRAVVNYDDERARGLSGRANDAVSFGIEAEDANIAAVEGSIEYQPFAVAADIIDNRSGESAHLTLPMPGRHNLSNALAAIAAAGAAGVNLEEAVEALSRFKGLARRFDVVGTTKSSITVIDDFGHNPEKCAATLRTLKSVPGRVIAFFQPHGYGPLRQMGDELAETFARELDATDITIMCDPVYFGGTVDRSQGSERIIELIKQAGGTAEHIASREDCGKRIAELAKDGDRIVIMGARDDTLSEFARTVLASVP
ncbi:Mur ligase family protein [Erythrobacter rubeus]|uniref:UDP-N-acetylmuramate--alanine ligase n=1 Tax=Erythrobacter rubeus TaxID=2760803 RepID=A0ABR8KTL3_9SPHN|nr:Mur ligase family protein [Erythrobacter rubeus]MBD2841587.1 UDP-N-acetylmuramate--alanine ligase [Erythrobacter rubeus]